MKTDAKTDEREQLLADIAVQIELLKELRWALWDRGQQRWAADAMAIIRGLERIGEEV